MKKQSGFILFLFLFTCLFLSKTNAQILGGGTTWATSVTFSQSWLTGCPSGSASFCNTSTCEPTTALDACGVAPACATGTTGSDVWFKFFAQSTTASIVLNPTSAFDIAAQAFRGSTCGGLTQVGCTDAAGANATETLSLTGLTPGELIYFRIFGATNTASQRTGNYTFCGSTGLGSAPLPVSISEVKLKSVNSLQCISWIANSEYDIEKYELQFSTSGLNFQTVSSLLAKNDLLAHSYNLCDSLKRTAGLYRIKIVEMNGKRGYSDILSILSKPAAGIQIYPNPVTDRLFIKSPEVEGANIFFRIIDIEGKNIKVGKLSVNRSINLNELKSGLYILQLFNDHVFQTFKFEKK
jgi:hypothetical protein